MDVSSPMYHIRESEISRDISESTKSIRQKTHDEDLARRVQLPETRLIQYDCGKLQTLHDLIYQKLRPNGNYYRINRIFYCIPNWNFQFLLFISKFRSSRVDFYANDENARRSWAISFLSRFDVQSAWWLDSARKTNSNYGNVQQRSENILHDSVDQIRRRWRQFNWRRYSHFLRFGLESNYWCSSSRQVKIKDILKYY